MDILALIPARGGSKGVPRKNIRILGGKPLIAYTINHALKSKLITRTIVSTDDPEIAEVARVYGAEAPFLRPAEYAQDSSLDLEVFLHAFEWLQKNENHVPDMFVHLRPTRPFRDVAKIDDAIKLMIAHPEADSLRSVTTPQQTPYKMWRIIDGYLEPLLQLEGVPEFYCMPRQALPKTWWQNGYVDIVRTRNLMNTRTMCGKKILAFIVGDYGVEIDYEDDFSKAEELIKHIQPDNFKEEQANLERFST